MWDVYDIEAAAQAAADAIAANMRLPEGPQDVTQRWAVPTPTGDGKWAIPTPADPSLLVGVTRGIATASPPWPATPEYGA
jgi:hypothetical protein